MSICTKCKNRGAFRNGLCFGCLFSDDKPMENYIAYEVKHSGIVEHIKKKGKWIS